ncbi:MAG: glycosyltransferase family 4 protein [Victivallaceae bacterium]|nr:glycosyltransferase family 4 protein [Victivallaceae bacterium]
MKLLFVGEFAGFAGGIERYIYKTAELLREHGHSISGLFKEPGKGEADFCTVFDKTYFLKELDSVPDDFDFAIIHKVRDPLIMATLLQRFRVITVIHDHEYYCPRHSLYYPIIYKNCFYTTSRLLCGLCGMTRLCSNSLLKKAYESFFTSPRLWHKICASERLVVLSEFMRKLAVTNGAPEDKTKIIYPYIKLPEVASSVKINSDPPHLLVPGQLVRGKGVDQLLKAVPKIKGEFVIDILGSGKDEERLRIQAKPLGEAVQFHGWQNHPETFFAKASAVLLPWRWLEPFGLVGPEALANGIPLVGFNVGGIDEYLIDGETGLLAPRGNIKAFAEAVSRIVASPELRAELGENGRELVRNKFSKQRFIESWETLLLSK